MTRVMLVFLGLFIMLTSMLGAHYASSMLALFVILSSAAFWVRIVLGTALLVYGLFPALRVTRARLVLLGVGLLCMGTLLLSARLRLLFVDEFIYAAGGIFALVGGLELAPPKEQAAVYDTFAAKQPKTLKLPQLAKLS